MNVKWVVGAVFLLLAALLVAQRCARPPRPMPSDGPPSGGDGAAPGGLAPNPAPERTDVVGPRPSSPDLLVLRVRRRGEPVAGARVAIEGLLAGAMRAEEATTGADGVVSLRGAAGPYDLRVRATTSVPADEASVTLRGERFTAQTVDLDLPAAVAEGVVVSSDGAPVADARLLAAGAGSPKLGGSAPDGTFAVGLASEGARLPIRIFARGHLPIPGTLVAGRGNRFELRRRPSVVGVVRDEAGQPLAGVEVVLRAVRSGSNDDVDAFADPLLGVTSIGTSGVRDGPKVLTVKVTTTTGQDGSYVLFAPCSGSGRISGVVPDLAVFSKEVELREETESRVDITVGPGELRGQHLTVDTDDGRPIPGVLVWFQDTELGLSTTTYAKLRTDEAGRVPLGAFRRGETMRLVVTPDPHGPRQPLLPPGNLNRVVVIEPGLVLRPGDR